METSKFDLDQKAINRLKRKIVIAENTNLRTKNKTDAQMIRDIKKWIEEEVQCCSDHHAGRKYESDPPVNKKRLDRFGQAFLPAFIRLKHTVTMLAAITRIVPISRRGPKGSRKITTPITTLVIGSRVLRIDVPSPPIRKALCWNRTTAQVVTRSEKRMQSPQPESVDGRTRLFVAIQMMNAAMLLIKMI